LVSRIVASDIDPRDALAQLGYAGVAGPSPLTGGWETLMWHFATPNGAEHALRIYCLEDAGRTAWRERVAMETCAAAGIATPRVETSGTYERMPAVVQTWCPGATLMSLIEARPWRVGSLGRLFGRTHARLRTLPAPPEFIATAPEDWLSRVLPEHRDLADRLLRAGTAGGTLIHLDYQPLNVIVSRSGETSVIDWAYSAAGDIRADLALTAVTLEIAPVPPGPMRPLINLIRKLAVRGWRAGYREVAGSMPDYRPYRAWACAMMLRGTVESLGRPGVWATEKDLAILREHIDRWSQEA
jgi:aminoglycoside phosphotransferase (APT) family kinase protein